MSQPVIDVRADFGTTSLFVTHDAQVAEQTDKLIVCSGCCMAGL